MRNRNLLHRIKSSVTSGFLLALAACQNGTVYHTYQPVPADGWARNDTLVYVLPTSIPTGRYEIEAGIRYKVNYPYQNIWLAVTSTLPDSLSCITDSLQLFLTDEAGNKTGNNPGGLYQYTLPFRSDFFLREGDSCTFCIVHLMQDNPLKGISDVGIRLRKADETERSDRMWRKQNN